MKRRQLFEFEDLPWFPSAIREGMTDYLQFLANQANIYKKITPILKKGLQKSGSNKILDICSGGGGGILKISENLKQEIGDVEITLSDYYPNISAFKRMAELAASNIKYIETPVDATQIPKELTGFRTQFLSFHHFPPEMCKKILQNAVDARAVIGVFEAVQRRYINFIPMLMTPITILLLTPFIRPLKISRLFFTYIIPAIPLCTLWDGSISVMRCYSADEMRQMTEEIDAPGYKWEIGNSGGIAGILYLLGYPEET